MMSHSKVRKERGGEGGEGIVEGRGPERKLMISVKLLLLSALHHM